MVYNKYQFYRLWFDPIGARSNDLRTRGQHTNHYPTDEVTLDIGDDCHGSTYNASRGGALSTRCHLVTIRRAWPVSIVGNM
jgi:hypothetical protein